MTHNSIVLVSTTNVKNIYKKKKRNDLSYCILFLTIERDKFYFYKNNATHIKIFKTMG